MGVFVVDQFLTYSSEIEIKIITKYVSLKYGNFTSQEVHKGSRIRTLRCGASSGMLTRVRNELRKAYEA